jgi:hypothetical protein
VQRWFDPSRLCQTIEKVIDLLLGHISAFLNACHELASNNSNGSRAQGILQRNRNDCE